VELRLGAKDGKKVGEGVFKVMQGAPDAQFMPGFGVIQVTEQGDGKLHDLYFVTKPLGKENPSALMSVEFKK